MERLFSTPVVALCRGFPRRSGCQTKSVRAPAMPPASSRGLDRRRGLQTPSRLHDPRRCLPGLNLAGVRSSRGGFISRIRRRDHGGARVIPRLDGSGDAPRIGSSEMCLGGRPTVVGIRRTRASRSERGLEGAKFLNDSRGPDGTVYGPTPIRKDFSVTGRRVYAIAPDGR